VFPSKLFELCNDNNPSSIKSRRSLTSSKDSSISLIRFSASKLIKLSNAIPLSWATVLSVLISSKQPLSALSILLLLRYAEIIFLSQFILFSSFLVISWATKILPSWSTKARPALPAIFQKSLFVIGLPDWYKVEKITVETPRLTPCPNVEVAIITLGFSLLINLSKGIRTSEIKSALWQKIPCLANLTHSVSSP